MNTHIARNLAQQVTIAATVHPMTADPDEITGAVRRIPECVRILRTPQLSVLERSAQTTEMSRRIAGVIVENAGGRTVLASLDSVNIPHDGSRTANFELAIATAREQVEPLRSAGVHGFAIGTGNIAEARAALLAVQEICGNTAPTLVSIDFDTHDSTTDDKITSALLTLQSLGATAFGIRVRPDRFAHVADTVRELKRHAAIPLFVDIEGSVNDSAAPTEIPKTSEFETDLQHWLKAGVNLVAFGTPIEPTIIRTAARIAESASPIPPRANRPPAVCSDRKVRFLPPQKQFSIVGERINPTGKKELQAELRKGGMEIVRRFAREQTAHGAAILDVNMGLSGINERAMMTAALDAIMDETDLPLCADSSAPDTIEAFLRVYPGRALVNSISAETSRLERTLPIVAKYGAMFILLPLDENGIPSEWKRRAKIAETILANAEPYGYGPNDVVVDGLIMAVSSNPEAARISLDTIKWAAHDLGTNTICGLSNVSFGMPQREAINAAFLALAIDHGLSMAIANPSSELVAQTRNIARHLISTPTA